MPPPEAAAITAVAGGNLAPTAPFLATAARTNGGNLAPTAPATQSAVRAAVAAGAVLVNGNSCAAGESIWIAAAEYYFISSTPTAAGEVAEEDTVALIAAINGTDGINEPHPLVRAEDAGGGDLAIRALVPGSAGNGYALGYDGTVPGLAWDGLVTSGGSDAWPVSGTPGGATAAAGGNLAPAAPGAIA